jgi:hypothetical protein
MRSEAAIRERLAGLKTYLDGTRERLSAGLGALNSPYLPEAHHEADDEYTDYLEEMIKALEGGIYELELVLDDEEVAENVRSVREIPDEFIDEDTREVWLARAKQDERVRAYRSADGHAWHVWDGSQRIELRESHGRTLAVRIEALVQRYRKRGMTLKEFEARILDVIQAAHTAPDPKPPSTAGVEDEQPA